MSFRIHQRLDTIIIAIVAVILASCTPKVAPIGEAAGKPHLSENGFVTADGLTLAVRRWVPADKPKAVILAAHGFNEYSKSFDAVPGTPGVGPFLSARGFAVYAYDQRGFGASPNFGLWPGRDVMVDDFTAFAEVLKHMYPGIKLYGLGESMGGAVVMTAMAGDHPPPLDGAILAAPAVWARSTMPMIYRAALWFAVHIAPGWTPTGQSLGRMASDNIPMLRDNGRDPLIIKETRIDAVYGLTNLMDDALAAAPTIKTPVLYLYGHNDQVIPRKPTREAVTALMTVDNQTRPAFYPNGYHMLLRDKEAPLVLEDVAAYLTNPVAALPSGEDVDAVARLKAAKGACPPCK